MYPWMNGHRRPLPKYNTNSTTLRTIINKWKLLKLRSFCKAKDTVIKAKWQHLNGKRSSRTTDKTEDWSPKYIKNSKVLLSTYQTMQFKKWHIDLNRILNKRIWNDWKTLKKLLNILSHQGKANKNVSEIASYTSQNG